MKAANSGLWADTSLQARVWFALRHAGERGLPTNTLQGMLGGGLKNLADALAGMQRAGWVAQASPANPWHLVDALQAPPIDGFHDAANPAIALPVRLVNLVMRHPAGIDTQALAMLADCTPQQAQDALEASPARADMVACDVLRQGQRYRIFRPSACGCMAFSWAGGNPVDALVRGGERGMLLRRERGLRAMRAGQAANSAAGSAAGA